LDSPVLIPQKEELLAVTNSYYKKDFLRVNKKAAGKRTNKGTLSAAFI
jgi:hypothetical protein